jgi:hypothetical protein
LHFNFDAEEIKIASGFSLKEFLLAGLLQEWHKGTI